MTGPDKEMSDRNQLDALLRQAGSRFDAASLDALIVGVLAAPEGEKPQIWMELVAKQASTALQSALAARKQCLQSRKSAEALAPKDRLPALRAELKRLGLQGFLVPRADEHQGEYVPARAGRLAWLTGFDGSAGIAVVLAEAAAIFVDGRYTLQVRDQVDTDQIETRHVTEEPPSQWLASRLAEGDKLGYDPWLHSRDQVEQLRKAVEGAGASLEPCDVNPLDTVWADQPPPPLGPVTLHDISHAGRSSVEKREQVAAILAEKKADAAVLTQPDSIAWLLNVRGSDVSRTPLPLSFAILAQDGRVDWYIDQRKLLPGVAAGLGNGVAIHAPDKLAAAIDGLGAAGKRVLIDPATAASWFFSRLADAGAQTLEGSDPCQLPKAEKNAVEREGARAAHRRDGVAVTRFLAWLDRAVENGQVDELGAATKLASFRRENGNFSDLSFDTISGSGPNGAIVHYRVTEQSNRRLQKGELYLVDSGGQYLDGTTDVTRTVAIGAASPEMRDRFTRVLKGHIALATARFPVGTTGSQLDTLARFALWQAGCDYDHGTGHGVGSFLGVHEGPQRISKVPNKVALAPGMIVSNEPGYYKTGAYGIRIENLVLVTEPEQRAGEDRPMLAFETLTLAPIDRRLVEPSLLSQGERDWLNHYHSRVREALAPHLDAETANWLMAATQPV